MILVTGATGNIGSELVRLLVAKKEQVRVLARDPAKASAKLGAGVEVVQGDLDQPASLAAALAGVDKAFLLASVPGQEESFIAAAKKAGVKHLVQNSTGGVPRGVGSAPVHAAGEKALQASSGMAWTILRPSEFMSNVLWLRDAIVGQGSIFRPTGDGKAAVIHPHDIAAAAAQVLTSPGHEGKTYELTGPQALSAAELATLLGAATGRTIRHVDVPLAAVRDQMSTLGMPPPLLDAVLGYYVSVKEGHEARIEPGLQQLLGTSGRTFETWARENAAVFH